MMRDRFSVASAFGNPASLLASCHGSVPCRANSETTLRVMPFDSVPTGANRNSFSPERRKAKASVLAILNSHNGTKTSYRTSYAVVIDTTCSVPVFGVSNGIFWAGTAARNLQHGSGFILLMVRPRSGEVALSTWQAAFDGGVHVVEARDSAQNSQLLERQLHAQWRSWLAGERSTYAWDELVYAGMLGSHQHRYTATRATAATISVGITTGGTKYSRNGTLDKLPSVLFQSPERCATVYLPLD